jgi:hypothetical protein
VYSPETFGLIRPVKAAETLSLLSPSAGGSSPKWLLRVGRVLLTSGAPMTISVSCAVSAASGGTSPGERPAPIAPPAGLGLFQNWAL